MAQARLKRGRKVVLLTARGRERVIKHKVDWSRVDAASEKDIGRHKAADDRNARADAAAYARRVRARTKLTQSEFARRIGVPVETVRNWEQGKRSPRGPARALLRVINEAPELAFSVLEKKPS